MAFGTEEELRKYVSDPKFVKDNRENLVLIFSDQVPWWVKVKSQRQLYTAAESTTQARKDAQEKFANAHKSNQETQKAEGLTFEEANEAPGDEGMTQKRGAAHQTNDKYRITLVLTQVVWNYFSPSKDPVGQFGLSTLILIGQYAQLSNIDDEHCFIEDKLFVVAGNEICHQKGTKTLLMYKWVDMRKEARERNDEKTLLYFSQFMDIMQQPAGFEDAIISKWIIEGQGKLYPLSIHQRDMFLGCMTRSSKLAMWLCQQAATWIAGKMTPACQITDTDVVFPVKGNAKNAEDDLRREFKAIAEAKGERCDWTCGPYEILRISAEAILKSKPKFDSGGILAAGVRNGQLSYRPDFEKNKLVRTDEQQWCQELLNAKGENVHLGSHRIKQSWIEKRYQWLDQHGRPYPPEWLPDKHKNGTAKLSQDLPDEMKDQTYVEEEGALFNLKSFEHGGFEAVSMTSEFTQEGDEKTFSWMSMVKEEDKVDFSMQQPLSSRHKVQWDKNLTQLKEKGACKAKKKQAIQKNFEMAASQEIEAKEEVAQVKDEFSKGQLLSMVIPSSQASKNKMSAADKVKLESKKSFGHVLSKVKAQELKQDHCLALLRPQPKPNNAFQIHLTLVLL